MIRWILILGTIIFYSTNLLALDNPNTGPAKGDPNAGKAKSEVCVACHGIDGNSVNPIWPKIADEPEKYLVHQLMEYRKGPQGKRFDPTMFGMTQNLTDQDILDIAAFYASQKATENKSNPKGMELGQKIYRGGDLARGIPACGPSCHGMRGEGLELAGIPKLSGQQLDYTIDQLKKFRAGVRADDANGIMRDIAKRMTDEEIEAVSNYAAGLH